MIRRVSTVHSLRRALYSRALVHHPRLARKMTTNTVTKAVYQHDALLHEYSTDVVSCRPASSLSEDEKPLFKIAEDGDYLVATSATIFHPQGGGQPSDTGTMALAPSSSSAGAASAEASPSFAVKLVRKLPSGTVLHLGAFPIAPPAPSASASTPFPPGSAVVQAVDASRRRFHSRLHTAGHLIGLAVRASSEIPVASEGKASHAPGSAFVEFGGLIGGEFRGVIEERANALVGRDLAVEIRWWDAATVRERCTAVPDAVPTAEGEDLRVVEVVGVGSYPCGGTHLPRTGDVGRITIRGIKRQKGVSKVSYSVEP